MEGHHNREEVKNHECGNNGGDTCSSDATCNMPTCDLCEGNKSQISNDKLLSGGDDEVKISHETKSAANSEGNDQEQQENVEIISNKPEDGRLKDRQRSRSLKDEFLNSGSGTAKNLEKRRRRRSTIRMTAKQTHEIQCSTSIISPKDSAHTNGYLSCDDELLTDLNSPKKNSISRVNIFVVARAVHRVGSGGEMVKAENPPCAQCVTVPSTASQIQHEILNSGMAFSSGKLDFV